MYEELCEKVSIDDGKLVFNKSYEFSKELFTIGYNLDTKNRKHAAIIHGVLYKLLSVDSSDF